MMLESFISIRTSVLFAAIVGYHFFFPFNAFNFVCALAGAVAYVLVLGLQPSAPQLLVGKKESSPPASTGGRRRKQKQFAHTDGCKANEDAEKKAEEKASTGAASKKSMNVTTSKAPTQASKPACQKMANQVDVRVEKLDPTMTAQQQKAVAENKVAILDSEIVEPKATEMVQVANQETGSAAMGSPSKTIEAPPLSDPVPAPPVLEYMGSFPTEVLSSQKEKAPNKPSRTPVEREIRKLEKKLRRVHQNQERMQSSETIEGNSPEQLVKAEDLEQQIAELRLLHCVMEQAAENEFLPMQLVNGTSSSWDGQFSTAEAPKEFPDIELCDVPPGFEDWFVPPPGLERKLETNFGANCNQDCSLPVGLQLPQERIEELARREDTCWCWINQGWCPRAAYCQWKHPPLW